MNIIKTYITFGAILFLHSGVLSFLIPLTEYLTNELSEAQHVKKFNSLFQLGL